METEAAKPSIWKILKRIGSELEHDKMFMVAGRLATSHKECTLEHLKQICCGTLENSFSKCADIHPYIADNEVKELIIYVVLLHVFYKANIWDTIGRSTQ